MAQVRVTQEILAPAQLVWGRIGDPASLASWHPGIVASPVEGDIRRLTLGDGGQIVERILARDDAGMRYRYSILDSPLPLSSYEGTLSVESAGARSLVTWESEFETEADTDSIATMLRGIYDAGLRALADAT